MNEQPRLKQTKVFFDFQTWHNNHEQSLKVIWSKVLLFIFLKFGPIFTRPGITYLILFRIVVVFKGKRWTNFLRGCYNNSAFGMTA